ncbi:extracellular solute-binding protein [Paenibacillus sp. WQ 127069]|uniref:Extracellular solute-binding protein n=1 Tax=Paenibacillus baimaensis TaxID=2982185 RepID=A0ABT2U8D5_9BACL|nr:extracellular solute-binding protein [Paenibacillus sp. WQ 127069]MCU6790892.1 extracellular solute-binding protein [Paenibacillus sp. WQ 127069]
MGTDHNQLYHKKLHRKKSGMAAVGVALSLGMIVSACGSGSELKGSSAPNSSEPGKDNKALELKIVSSLYNEVPKLDNAIWSEIQKRTNTKFTVDWVPAPEYNSKLDLFLASNELPDILVVTSEKYLPVVNAAKQGVFWDLTPLLGDYKDYPNLKKIIPERAKFLTIDGKLYTLPRTRGKLDTIVQIRKDWLDKVGLPLPTTIDEFNVALKKIVESDPDGNGKKDTIGMQFNDYFAGAFGIWDPVNNSEGGLIHPFLTGNYNDFVAWNRERYADGVMPKEFSVMKGAQIQDLFTSGVSATHIWNIYHAWTATDAIKKVQPAANVDSILLKGPKGYAVAHTKMTTGGIMIPKKVPEAKVKQILKFYDSMATAEMTDLVSYGVDGVHYKTDNGERKLTDIGKKEINVDVNQFMVLAEDKWLKVVHPQAPKAWNDAKKAQMEKYEVEKVGKVRLEEVLLSDTWLKIWPKYLDEWTAIRTKTIIGETSLADYKAYVEKLNNMPDFKKAYKEFADNYKTMMQ